MSDQNDELAVRRLVDQFVEGWNAHDGGLCARPFAEDADFTAITGLWARGRHLIGRGHSEILSTIYRATNIRSTVQWVRFLRPDVAVADVTFDYLGESPVKQALAELVATRENGEWSIAVFRNMVPFARPFAGPLDRAIPQSVMVASTNGVT